ncbi:MAG: hypothetical protein R3C03_13240 [Pirellulaceae bacterium]
MLQIITDVAGNTYVRYTYSFTADSNTATITFTDTSDTAGVSDNTNSVDAYIDNISVQYQSGTFSAVSFSEGGSAVVLDGDVQIFDAELSGIDNQWLDIDVEPATAEPMPMTLWHSTESPDDEWFERLGQWRDSRHLHLHRRRIA